ncbi:MAG: chromosome segregation protein SMC [Cyclobacteriaceae bacterium]|nr:chromosome segregation protein SMC [Cyclobacteriaceae bacterium]
MLIGVILVLLAVVGFFLYQQWQDKTQVQSKLSATEDELEDTYLKLERVGDELELKIEEIRKLGGDVEELLQAKDQLEKEKSQLRRSASLAQNRYDEIKDKVEGYEELLKKKDRDIAKLEELNKKLADENTDLRGVKNQLTDSLREVRSTKRNLEDKVSIASRLKATNFEIIAINSRGRERDGGEYRNRHIDKLRIGFSIMDNPVAPIEGKDLFLRVIEPGGEVIFDVSKGSGSFTVEGKERFYTLKKEILFDNSGQKISFDYEKGDDYESGDHTVEVYTEDYLMGKGVFTVR